MSYDLRVKSVEWPREIIVEQFEHGRRMADHCLNCVIFSAFLLLSTKIPHENSEGENPGTGRGGSGKKACESTDLKIQQKCKSFFVVERFVMSFGVLIKQNIASNNFPITFYKQDNQHKLYTGPDYKLFLLFPPTTKFVGIIKGGIKLKSWNLQSALPRCALQALSISGGQDSSFSKSLIWTQVSGVGRASLIHIPA